MKSLRDKDFLGHTMYFLWLMVALLNGIFWYAWWRYIQ